MLCCVFASSVVVSCHVLLGAGVSGLVMPCCVVLCPILSCAVLCHVLSCWAVACGVLLCCCVSYNVVSRSSSVLAPF